jgi:hypothetical protein
MGPINLSAPIKSPRILASLENGTLLTCCDGSYNSIEHLGSNGWVFATHTTTLWHGAGPIDSHSKLVSSYRAEIGGLVNVFHILMPSYRYHIISGALNKLQKSTYVSIKDFLVPDYDLLNEGRVLLKQLNVVMG